MNFFLNGGSLMPSIVTSSWLSASPPPPPMPGIMNWSTTPLMRPNTAG